MTNGIIFLIPYEKKQLKSNTCLCGNKVDLDTIIKHIRYNQEDEKEASYRLKQYIITLCLICLHDLRE